MIINYSSDRDPYALRLAIAKDTPSLRAKCEPGVLFFSKLGRPLQEHLGWDFDGDYFQIITDEKLVNSFSGSILPMPQPELEDTELKTVPVETWVDVNAHFLSEYPPKLEVCGGDFGGRGTKKQTEGVWSLQLVQHTCEQVRKDFMGLFHYQWQLLAGRGPSAAASETARQVAANYSQSLDVEKGKPCPREPSFENARTWDCR